MRLDGYVYPLAYAATFKPLLATHNRIGRENDTPFMGVGPNGKGSKRYNAVENLSVRELVNSPYCSFSTRCALLHQVGAVSVHICLGPFGCNDKNHPHSLPAQAA